MRFEYLARRLHSFVPVIKLQSVSFRVDENVNYKRNKNQQRHKEEFRVLQTVDNLMFRDHKHSTTSANVVPNKSNETKNNKD